MNITLRSRPGQIKFSSGGLWPAQLDGFFLTKPSGDVDRELMVQLIGSGFRTGTALVPGAENDLHVLQELPVEIDLDDPAHFEQRAMSLKIASILRVKILGVPYELRTTSQIAASDLAGALELAKDLQARNATLVLVGKPIAVDTTGQSKTIYIPNIVFGSHAR